MDTIYNSFLESQEAEAKVLSRDSDLLDIVAQGERPYQRYILEYSCKGLVQTGEGIVEADQFAVGVHFPIDFCRRSVPYEVVTFLGPVECHHPNILFPMICIGPIRPSTSLFELALRCFEVITFNAVTMYEPDALNHAACRWARKNVERFPVDDRPLKRRQLDLTVNDKATPEDS